MESQEKAYRLTASPWQLLRTAIGDRRAVTEKSTRFLRTLLDALRGKEVRRRLELLESRKLIGKIPTRLQLLAGAYDNVRYFIVPGVEDFYPQRNINFAFHQLLRWLEDPSSMIDPSGFLSKKETIIGHLLQVVHNDPVYDFQMLGLCPDGLEDLERETREVIAGTHSRAATLRATTEDVDYYERLLSFIQGYRKDPSGLSWTRGETEKLQSPEYQRAKRTFRTLYGTMRYCAKLPTELPAILRHVLRDRAMPPEWAEPEETTLAASA